MANTGYKGYATLEEYYIDDNSATGITKPNDSYLPEYVAPVYDTTSCPVDNTYISASPDMYEFGMAGGATVIIVTSDYDSVDIVANDTWFQVYPAISAGSFGITLNCDPTTEIRWGVINLSRSGVNIFSIIVSQTT